MIIQRDTDKWLTEQAAPESFDGEAVFTLSYSGAVFMGYFLGPPVKTVQYMQSARVAIRRRI